MTTHEQVQKYMDSLGWSTIQLARLTNIHHITLQEFLNGDKPLTMNQLLNIINKFTQQYPKDQHWTIYHDITLAPILTGKQK